MTTFTESTPKGLITYNVNPTITEQFSYQVKGLDADAKDLLTVHWEIAQLSKKLSAQYLYLKKHIDAFV